MNTLIRSFPSPRGTCRPLVRRLADDIGLTVIVCSMTAVLITLVNGRTFELYDQMVYSICVGLVALVVLDGVRLTLLDDPARRRRWLVPCIVLLVAMAPVAHYTGISLGSLILGQPLPDLSEYPNDHGQKGMIGLTFLAISAMALLILNRERVERIKLERTEAKMRAETIERQALQAQLQMLQAQIELSTMYANGDGVEKNVAESLKWTLRIATSPTASVFWLDKAGDIFLDGWETVPKNYPKAREFYERAVAKDDPYAMRKLGRMYVEGLGVGKDPVKARDLLQKADALSPPAQQPAGN